MTVEELKELRQKLVSWELDCNDRKQLAKHLDAEIARQSTTSEEVQRAIEVLDLLELSTKLEMSEGVHNHVADKITTDGFFRAKCLAIQALKEWGK